MMLIPGKGSFNWEKSETETVFLLNYKKNKASRQPTEGFGKFDLVSYSKTLSTCSNGKLNASATPS